MQAVAAVEQYGRLAESHWSRFGNVDPGDADHLDCFEQENDPVHEIQKMSFVGCS